MPLSIQNLCERSVRKARGGFSESEAGIDVARAAMLVPEALSDLAIMIAKDGQRRDILRTEFTVILTSGVADLSSTDYDYLLREALEYSTAFDADDTERTFPLVYKRHAHQLNWGVNPAFGYYAFENNKIKTRQKGNAGPSNMTSLTLIANYIPAMGSNAPTPTNPYVLPVELEDEAITILAEKLVEGARLK